MKRRRINVVIPVETTEIASSPCPACGATLDRASPLNGVDLPEPGALTVCSRCGELLCLDEELHHRPFTAEKDTELMIKAPRELLILLEMQAAVRSAEKTIVLPARPQPKM